MELLRVLLEDRDFDRIVHTGLPENGDLKIALKRRGTVEGRPMVAFGFTVTLPDGTTRPVQAVTTLRLLASSVDALRAAAGWPRGQIPD